jgi:phage gpG-like protein
MIKAVLVGGKQVEQRLDEVYPKVQTRLLTSMQRIVIELTRKIKQEKLSGQVLKTGPSGTLRRSITPSVNADGNTITGHVGTNLEYAAIHEYGGRTPPHVIEPKHAQALAFFSSNFAMAALRGGDKWIVKRRSTIPARSSPSAPSCGAP